MGWKDNQYFKSWDKYIIFPTQLIIHQKSAWILVLPLLSFLACKTNDRLASEKVVPPTVILKLDDLKFENDLVHPGWIQVIDFLNKENVLGTIGLICNSLVEDNPSYFEWIKDREQEGYEIWHHGFCHCKPSIAGKEMKEFAGTDYDYQLDQLRNGQQLAKKKLGITFRSFGAPYNATDEHTALALHRLPDIKVWMYKDSEAPTDKYVLGRIIDVNIEFPVHVPNFRKFKEGYEKNKSAPLIVIQGHPRSWTKDSSRMEEFKQIIFYLKSKGVRFTTPYTYYLEQLKMAR